VRYGTLVDQWRRHTTSDPPPTNRDHSMPTSHSVEIQIYYRLCSPSLLPAAAPRSGNEMFIFHRLLLLLSSSSSRHTGSFAACRRRRCCCDCCVCCCRRRRSCRRNKRNVRPGIVVTVMSIMSRSMGNTQHVLSYSRHSNAHLFHIYRSYIGPIYFTSLLTHTPSTVPGRSLPALLGFSGKPKPLANNRSSSFILLLFFGHTNIETYIRSMIYYICEKVDKFGRLLCFWFGV